MLNEDQNAQSSGRQSDEQSSQPKPEVPPATTKLDVPPPPPQCKYSHAKKKHWIDYATFTLELLGLVALCVYAAFTIGIYRANKKAADAAKSAADTARDALVIGNRPWMKVDLQQTAPLEFLPDGSAKIGIQEKMENVGSGVALRVESWFDIFPLGSGQNIFVAAKARQKESCDAWRIPKSTIFTGEDIFPHDPRLYSFSSIPIPKDRIVPIKNSEPGMRGKIGQVGFVLVGCVSYRSSFEAPTVPSHETLFEYWIAKPFEKGGAIPYVDPSGTHPDYKLFPVPDNLTAD